MAGSFEDLITFLLEEIALCGDQGASISDFKAYVKKFYDIVPVLAECSSGISRQDATTILPPTKPTVDRSLEEVVWKWLTAHPDIRVGKKREGNKLSLAQAEELEATNRGDESQNTASPNIQHGNAGNASTVNSFDNTSVSTINTGGTQVEANANSLIKHHRPNTATPTPSGRPSLKSLPAAVSSLGLRICTDEGRMWHAVAGHGVDPTKISRLEFELLSLVAKHGEAGILQPELTRLSGQDKRSVPKRTDKLHAGGYIRKTAASAKGLATSVCLHRRFFGVDPVKQQVREDITITGSVIVEGKEIVKDGVILTDNLLDVVCQLLSKYGIITQGDFRRKMGFEGRRWESKTLFRYIRRLEALGCVQRVKAKDVGSTKTFKCVKFLRMPTDGDLQLTKSHLLNHGLPNDERTLDVDADGDDDLDASAEAVGDSRDSHLVHTAIEEIPRTPPQWTLEQPMHNFLFDLIDSSGSNGISTMDLKRQGLGSFSDRPVEVTLNYLTDYWQLSQPPHLRHLAIVRDTQMRNKIAHYQYRTYSNFNAAVEAGEATWEAVSTTHNSAVKKATQGGTALNNEELDEWGFPKISGNRFSGRGGTATIGECSDAVKDPANSGRPAAFHKILTNSIPQATESGDSVVAEPLHSKIRNVKRNILPFKKPGRPRKYGNGQESYQSSNLTAERREARRLEQWNDEVRRRAEIIAREEVVASNKRTAQQAGFEHDKRPVDAQVDAVQNLLDAAMAVDPELAQTEIPPSRADSAHRLATPNKPKSLINRQRVALGLPVKLGRPSKSDKLELERQAREVGVNLDQLRKDVESPESKQNDDKLGLSTRTEDHSHSHSADLAPNSPVFATAANASTRINGCKRRKTQKLREAEDDAIELPEDRVQQLMTEIKSLSQPGLYINPPHAKRSTTGRPKKRPLLLVFKLPALKTLNWFVGDASCSFAANDKINDEVDLLGRQSLTGEDGQPQSTKIRTTRSDAAIFGSTNGPSPTSIPPAKAVSPHADRLAGGEDRATWPTSNHVPSTGSTPSDLGDSPTLQRAIDTSDALPSNLPYTYRSPYAAKDSVYSSPYASTTPGTSRSRTEDPASGASERKLVSAGHSGPLSIISRDPEPQCTLEPVPGRVASDALYPTHERSWLSNLGASKVRNVNHQGSDLSLAVASSVSGLREISLAGSQQSGTPPQIHSAQQSVLSSFPSGAAATGVSNAGEQLVQTENAMQKDVDFSAQSSNVPEEVEKDSWIQPLHSTTAYDDSYESHINVDGPVIAPSPSVAAQASDQGKTPQRKAGVVLTGGSLGYHRNKIIMDMMDKCGGVFPGGHEIWYPFVTEWSKLYEGPRPDRNTVVRAIKNLVGSGKLRRASFAFRGTKGEVVTKSVLITATTAPDSEPVRETQKQMIEKYPGLYIPSQVEVMEDVAIHESKTINEQHQLWKDKQGPPKVVTETVERQFETNSDLKVRLRKAGVQRKRQAKMVKQQAKQERKEQRQRKRERFEARLRRLEGIEIMDTSTGQNAMQSNHKLGNYSHKPQPAPKPLKIGRGVKRLHSLKGPTQRTPLAHRPLPTDPLQHAFPTSKTVQSNPQGTNNLPDLPSMSGVLDFDWRIDPDANDEEIFPDQGHFRAFRDFGAPYRNFEVSEPSARRGAGIDGPFSAQHSFSATPLYSQVISSPEGYDGQEFATPGVVPGVDKTARTTQRKARKSRIGPGGIADSNAKSRNAQWTFVNEGPVTYDPDYDKVQISTLMDPNQTFHAVTGTFSTEFYVTRSARQVLWSAPDPYAEFLKSMPTCLEDILKRPQPGKPRDHTKWADPAFSRFCWEIQRLQTWEKWLCDRNYCGYTLGHFNFICHSFPTAHHVADDTVKLIMWDNPSSEMYSPNKPPPLDAPVEPADWIDMEKYLEAVHTRRRGALKVKAVPHQKPTVPQPQVSRARKSVRMAVVASPVSTESIDEDTQVSTLSTHNAHAAVQPHANRDRGRLTASIWSKDEVQKFVTAVVVTRTLAGGVRRKIDWDTITKLRLFGQDFDVKFLRRRWGAIYGRRKFQIEKLAVDFQESFIRAYEDGIVPPINFDNIETYDWATLIEWTMKNMELPDGELLPDLPATRQELEEYYNINEITHFTDQSLAKEEFMNIASTLARREEILGDFSFSYPLDPSYTSCGDREVSSEDDEPLAVAKTWIRANIATAEDIYDSHAARDKLLQLGPPLIDRALASLLSSKVLRQENKGRLIPGRNYDITDSFLNSFRKALEPSHFYSAVAYKKELDASFREQGFAMLSYHAKDGDCVALLNLVAGGRVRIGPMLDREKFGKWGLVEGGYKTKKMDRRRLEFGVGIWPTEMWVGGNPLLDGEDVLPRPPPPPTPHWTAGLGDTAAASVAVDGDADIIMQDLSATAGDGIPLSQQKIPTWYDIHGNFIQSAWQMVGAAVLSCVALRAGIGPKDIAKSVKGSVGVWEVRLVLEWMERVGAVKRISEDAHGWTTREWWWAVFGEG